ncbi:hypothetical protein KDA23_03825 [Candidatus Saccharibacteria bacterium]|nr:hypothetical protein [Candidatus Saccharibacteria bacterium]
MIRNGEPLLINTGDVDNPVPISQAILDGYAPGGELYNFAKFPEFSEAELRAMQDQPYASVFYTVTKKLLGNTMPDEVLRDTAEAAYSPDNFDFDEDGSLRFTTLPSGIHVVGLSDGPTGAFKDMAMQPFARWMSYLQAQKGDPLTILLSTSGDTGPAALNAFSGLPNTEIINMMPNQGVSPFQWSQMAEMQGQPGVHVLEVEGDFTYINDIQMTADLAYDLSAVNSVNIARIVAQIPYYFASYMKAIRLNGGEVGDPVDVSIPSGNFGNALSGIIARKMGLPLRNLIIAPNENNTLDAVINSGVFKLADLVRTDSSAQDVRMPSNIWRYFGMLYGNNPDKIAAVYQKLTTRGTVNLYEMGVADESIRWDVHATTVTAAGRAAMIRSVFIDTNGEVVIDPHTANGLAAIEQLGAYDPDVPMLTLETAKPFKFDSVIEGILRVTPSRPSRFEGLEAEQRGKRLVRIWDDRDLLEYVGFNTNAKAKAK